VISIRVRVGEIITKGGVQEGAISKGRVQGGAIRKEGGRSVIDLLWGGLLMVGGFPQVETKIMTIKAEVEVMGGVNKIFRYLINYVVIVQKLEIIVENLLRQAAKMERVLFPLLCFIIFIVSITMKLF
jgi:hypothetical protein